MTDDIVERLEKSDGLTAVPWAGGGGITMPADTGLLREAAKEIRQLRDEIERLRDALDIEYERYLRACQRSGW